MSIRAAVLVSFVFVICSSPALSKPGGKDNKPVAGKAGVGKGSVGDTDFTRWKRLAEKGKVSSRAFKTVTEALFSHKNPFVRREAAQYLHLSGPKAIPALIKGLSDKERYVAVNSAVSLGKLGPAASRAVPFIHKQLRSRTWGLYQPPWRVMRALGKIGTAAVPALAEFGLDFNRYIRQSAIRVLKKMGKPALDVLRKQAKNAKTKAARDNAKRILQVLGRKKG